MMKSGQRWVDGFERFEIDMPTDQPQEHDWTCGPNSVARLLRSYGIDVSYEQAIEFTRYDGNIISWLKLGTPPSQLIDTLRHWKPDARMLTEQHTPAIQNLIKQGKPVILLVSMGKINIPGGTVGELHYVVVNGYDEATNSYRITNTDGVQSWWSYETLLHRWTWINDFTGVSGEAAQFALGLDGFKKRTMFY